MNVGKGKVIPLLS